MKHEYRFHFQVGFPKGRFLRDLPSGTITLSYSHHAATEAARDRYLQPGEALRLPETLDTSTALLVELYTMADGTVTKAVYRARYDRTRDLVMVVTPGGRCVTCWLNVRSDKHSTLVPAQYDKPAKGGRVK
jgi:hypothetical protein